MYNYIHFIKSSIILFLLIPLSLSSQIRKKYKISYINILITVHGIGIVICGNIVTTITTLSMSAISTNGRIKAGEPKTNY